MKDKKIFSIKKVVIITLVVFVFLIYLSLCTMSNEDIHKFLYGIPGDWQKVELEGYSSKHYINVPQSWEVSTVDGYMYFTSNESNEKKNILVQYLTHYNEDLGYFETNDYFDYIDERIALNGEIFSNSADFEKYRFVYKDGSSEELFVLSFYGGTHELTEFYCVDDSIPEDILKTIAKSYNVCD